MDAATQYALAYALTTTAGVRALLALAGLSFVVHAGWLHAPAGFAWLGSTGAMWALGAVAVAEIVADKVPLLDHAGHVLGVVVKPAAGAVLAGGALHVQSHEALVGLMVLGALNAFGVHAAVASVRAASTATTAGFANPLLSIFEDVSSVVALIVTFLLPFVAAALALCFSIVVVVIARTALRARKTAS